MKVTNVVIVGAGPAGIGVASLLKQTNIDFLVLEKKDIGCSFVEWPKNMEMITPSFPSNAFGQMDLNSICESTSPAFSFKKEHLKGDEYADYLTSIVDYFQLPVETNTEVRKVYNQLGSWVLDTSQGLIWAKYLIWAAGEFQNPQINNIYGVENCIHSSEIAHPDQMEGDNFVVVGGYESGVQMAFDLVQSNKKVTLVNPSRIDDANTSDPSKVLSPYTLIKYNKIKNSPGYTEILDEVTGVMKEGEVYRVRLKDGSLIETDSMPICATGFSLVDKPIEEFITYREDGFPQLKPETDEFFGCENIYLSGPSVRHDNHIFCFIYKFRQRFGIIAEDIFRKEELETEEIQKLVNRWRRNGMYMSDLSCCGEECVC
ncbi:MAG: NAD(P)/FAD-dependent oxidoreductase [Bacteroidota bacterium]